MIRELIEFTKSLDENIKSLSFKPSHGLHILTVIDENENISIDQYLLYNGDDNIDSSLEEVSFFEKYSSYISMNQQQKFDKKQKIHSASPFSFAFNFSLGSNKNSILADLKSKIVNGEIENDLNIASKEYKISEVKNRIKDYFLNAKHLCLERENNEINRMITRFESFCTTELFDELHRLTMLKKTSKKEEAEEYEEVCIFNELKEKEYVRVYLKSIPANIWKQAYSYYYESEYPPNELKESDFLTTYDAKKPFKIHHTASFDKNIRIDGKEAKMLKDFKALLSIKPRSVLPNPLPVFIFQEELQKRVISLFKENGFKIGYKEIIEKLWDDYKNEFGNYYLLFYQNTKDGLVFRDFDFVPKFEYELRDMEGVYWRIEDLFSVNFGFELKTVFDFQNSVLQIIFNNSLIVKAKNNNWIYKYFDEIDEKYCKSAKNYLLLINYRKAFYDYTYKSQRQSIDKHAFDDIMLTSILEDIRLDEFKNKSHSEYFNIRKKLNIWFSLYEKFNFYTNHEKSMASKLKEYQQFVADLAGEKTDTSEATVEQFAFAAGQVIYYILKKSKSTDQSYQRLERYLQQVKFSGFKDVITNEFSRYKHENYSKRFERVASFVLTFETNESVKKYLPQILAGVFASNQLYSEKDKSETETLEKE